MCAENAEIKKALLVCSSGCSRVREHLLRAGYSVTGVDQGTAALERARHEILSAAVLVSTGTEMDLAETVFNLKDIDPGIKIIIIADSENPEEKTAQTNAIIRACPGTPVLRVNELERYLTLH